MGNSRNFKPGRSSRRQSLKEQIKGQGRELAYMRGLNLGLEAQLAATKMERPADLEAWIESVALEDMDDEERAQWESMTPDDRERFLDELGEKINTTQKLATVGLNTGDGGAAPSPLAP